MKKLLCLMCVFAFLLCGSGLAENVQFYANAVADAMHAEKEEIIPLIELKPGNVLTSWNEDLDRVLLVSWNRDPDLFPAGENYTTTAELPLWCVTDRELQAWIDRNGDGVSDWTLRLEQLIGLPENFGYTHFSAFWVKPADVIRPAYQPDPCAQLAEGMLDGSALGIHAQWFAENARWSYVDSAWPWTRLGYTYDWADNGAAVGLNEFLILDGAELQVAWTMSTEELVEKYMK